MSNRALTWAEGQTTGSPGRKSVLMVLADKADEEHSCWPSQETIARITEHGVSTVREHLKRLEADGFITRARRNNADGSRSSDRYVLSVSVAVGITPAAYRQESAVGQAPETGGRNQAPETGGRNPDMPESVPVEVPPETGGRDDALPLDLGEPTARSQQVTHREPKERTTKNSSSKTARATTGEKPPTSTADPRFVEFWSACPRMVAKAAAFRKYQDAIRKGITSTTLLDGMRAYAASVRGKDPQFIVHPATWLHQGRWDDQPDPVALASPRQAFWNN